MRSAIVGLVVLLATATGCLGPDVGSPTGHSAVEPAAAVSDSSPAQLPGCGGIYTQLPQGSSIVPVAGEGDLAVVIDKNQAVCSDPLPTLQDLGLISLAEVEAISQMAAISAESIPTGGGDPIPAKGADVSGGDPIPASPTSMRSSSVSVHGASH